MPIKTQNQIHDFFDNDKEEKLYFHINYQPHKVIQERCKAYYPFINTKCFRKSKPLKLLSKILGKLQIVFGVNRLKNNPFYPLYNGWNWFSIPNDFAKYVVSKRAEIIRCFSKTLASDEVVMQSVAMHSPFADRVYGYNGKNDPIDASKRFIDWKRGTPWVFIKSDFEMITRNQKSFFARKFDENIDKEIIDLIYGELSNS